MGGGGGCSSVSLLLHMVHPTPLLTFKTHSFSYFSGCCAVDPTFTAIVEQRATKEVDTAFFISPVPITSFDSKTLLTTFPKANREGVAQTRDDLKRQISKAGREGWTLQALMADFHLLLFLCDYFDIHADMPQICHSVRQNDVPIDEGYQLLIRSIAGLDG